MAGNRVLDEQVLKAAVAQLAAGDGLYSLGLTKHGLARRADYAASALTKRFGRGTKGLCNYVLGWWAGELRGLVDANVHDYRLLTQALEAGAEPRKLLRQALTEDLADYTVFTDDATVRARERVYYLAVALADRPPGAEAPDFSGIVRTAVAQTQNRYRIVYEEFLGAFDRVADDLESLQRGVNALLEGFTLHARLGLAVDPDEVTDGVIALMYAKSRPRDGEAVDVAEALFGRRSQG